MAEPAHMEERLSYEDSLKYYRDLKNSLDTAREEGWNEGKIEGKIEGTMEEKINVVRRGAAKGYPPELLAELAGLTLEEVDDILRNG